MQKKQSNEYLDTVIIGSGLSALNFIETYSKKKKIDVISPNFNFKLSGGGIEEIKFSNPKPNEFLHSSGLVEATEY